MLVSVAAACGADSCDGQAYVMTPNGTRVPLPFGGHMACSADGAFVVADVLQAPQGEEAFYDPRQWLVVLHKFPTDGSAASPFADCMSPALTPEGDGFLCRDRAGAVLLVGLEGGAARVVAEAGVPASDVAYNPQSHVYPDPPRVEAGVLRFSVETAAGVLEREAPWPPSLPPQPAAQPEAVAPAVEPGPRPRPPRRSQRDLPSCGVWWCDDEGNCDAPSPPNCRQSWTKTPSCRAARGQRA
jgi:hypothetical protein